MSFPRRMVKTRSRPPEIMRKTKTKRAKLKGSGREGWIFFNPTKGTYQSRKMKKKRIKQVKTKRPIKVLFLGLSSKTTSLKIRITECGMQSSIHSDLEIRIGHSFYFRSLISSLLFAILNLHIPKSAIRIPQYYLKTVPTGIGCPANKSRTLILLFPSN